MMKGLVRDFSFFVQVIVFWPFAYLVMLPMKVIDRFFGTRMLASTIKLIKFIANSQ
jgi:hypothetical protein